MSKKKKKKQPKNKPQKPIRSEVRLSQCLIVRNEEKNIERALKWAKNIAFEQIVVDTGSTDRTIKLAEGAGAKVYHYKWIDDFSAAKNFAMDKATGEWIAFLDADEYMSEEDADKLIKLLGKIENDRDLNNECEAITCTFIDLDDNGNTTQIGTHQRIYRNRPNLRFKGKIHEAVKIQKTNYNTNEIKIYHTGYAQSVYKETGKLERNIKMLRKEYDENPENPDIMHYLANSIISLGTDEALTEAEELHLRALESKKKVNIPVRQLAYDFLIPRFTENGRTDEATKLCSKAINDIPENIDYRYYRAVLYNKNKKYQQALDDLKECEWIFKSENTIFTTRLLTPSPLPLFFQLRVASEGLRNEQAVNNYKEIIKVVLFNAKNQTGILGPYIRAMSWSGLSDDEVLLNLTEVYDTKNPKDMMLIARAAKDSGAIDFTRKVMEMLQALMSK